jgi:hypothetical protein
MKVSSVHCKFGFGLTEFSFSLIEKLIDRRFQKMKLDEVIEESRYSLICCREESREKRLYSFCLRETLDSAEEFDKKSLRETLLV